jgi:radical SAM protein with 4Fe4S-binding SPASM domain
MQGKKRFEEKLFTNFQLSDRVPEDNFYRRLKNTLDLRFIYKLTAKYYGTEGQESIDPIVFFKLMLVGYFENLASDRRIISTASLRLDILYFIGYNIDEPLPWHSTLSRTRQLFGEEVFKELFRTVLKSCIDKGMVAGRRQAIDSALIKANASMDTLADKEVMKDVDIYADELIANQEESFKKKVDPYRKKKVEQHHRWKQKAYQGMPGSRVGQYADNDKRPKFLSNHTHYSTTDPDARVAVKPGKPRQLNYLAQTCVDTAHHVITHLEAYHADRKDSQCLPRVLDVLTENLNQHGLIVDEIMADTGYSSGEALKALEQKNITGYIPNFGQYKHEREGFTYHSEGDYYTCSQNKKLKFKNIKNNNGYSAKEYRTLRTDCKDCPLRTTCIGKGFEKKIVDTADKAYYDKMHQRMKTSYARKMKKLRQSTVEPVLGTLINFLGMKRINTRGITLANKCMILAGVAYNIKKLLKFRTPKALSMVMEITTPSYPNTLSFAFF